MLHHVLNDLESTLWVVKVLVLNAGLDDIERSGNYERSGCTSNRSNEVLEPRGFVIVFQSEEVTLGECRSTEKL